MYPNISPHRRPQFYQTFLVNVNFTLKDKKYNNDIYIGFK